MSSINEINWFPGHMKKALDQIQDNLKKVDGVIEIGDARAPFSSFPAYLDKITASKCKVFVFSKADLADPEVLRKQCAILKEQGKEPFILDLRDKKASKALLNHLASIRNKEDEKYLRLGFPLPIKRFMVLGIPNVGKSTFINSLAGKKKAAVENKPGKTRAQQMIHVTEKIYVFDTPGILQPDYEDKTAIAKLASLGSIKKDILPLIALSDFLLDILKNRYKDLLFSRYEIADEKREEEFFLELAKRRNVLSKDGIYDTDRARELFLSEFQKGKIGRISLDE